MSQITDNQYNFASLYVGDLKYEVTEQHLWSAFSGYGQILSVKVCRDSTTGSSLGYAYINFRTLEEAEKAMTTLNYCPIEGKPCRIMWSMRDPMKRRTNEGNLFLKNIDLSIDSRALYDAFSVFGPIMSCKLSTDDSGRSKGFGFIQFYNEEHAKNALEKVHGVEFMDKKIMVTKFVPRTQRYGEGDPVKPKFTNLFIKNFDDEWDADDLNAKFSRFGKITSHVVVKDQTGKSRGFGFVNFEKSEDAEKAVAECSNLKTPKGLDVYVGRALKKSERMEQLKSEYMKKRQEQIKKCQDLNIYIKPLELNMTDDILKDKFSQFGTIQSYKIMRDNSGRSRGFGFVCFSTSEEAQRAIKEMNGKIIDSKPLVVTIAQLKEERRREIHLKRMNNPSNNPVYAGPQFPIVQFPQMNQGYQPLFRFQQMGNAQRSIPRQPPNVIPSQMAGQRPHIPYQAIPYGGNVQFGSNQRRNPGSYQGQRSNMPHYNRNHGMVQGSFYAPGADNSSMRPMPGANTLQASVNYVEGTQENTQTTNNGDVKVASQVQVREKQSSHGAVDEERERIVGKLSEITKRNLPDESPEVLATVVNTALDSLMQNNRGLDNDSLLHDCVKAAIKFVKTQKPGSESSSSARGKVTSTH